jgi:hypothetical protein
MNLTPEPPSQQAGRGSKRGFFRSEKSFKYPCTALVAKISL